MKITIFFSHSPDIKIIGEKQIRIVHNLIGIPGAEISEITRVYSHPVASSSVRDILIHL